MASPVNPPRGMRDFLPADKARRERVLSVIREVYSAHGFDEIETPVMEDSSRLHAGLGGDNEKLAFGVLKRGLAAEDFAAASDPLDLSDLGLRFDLTVPLTRFYASHRAELPAVFRAVQLAPVWRAERPQKGRYRQFMQCDIDIIGEAGPLAEVELITATVATLQALSLSGCSIRINDRRILTAMLEVLGFAAEHHDAAVITIDKLDKIGVSGVTQELRDRGFDLDAVAALETFLERSTVSSGAPLPFGVEGITAALPEGVDPALIAPLAELGAAVAAATAGTSGAASTTASVPGSAPAPALGLDGSADAGVPAETVAESSTPAPAVELVFDPFLVRGMGYYTGTVFEIAHPASSGSLGGGGRYDGMVGRFLGVDVPAAGFSIGFERIVDLVSLADSEARESVALLYDVDAAPAALVALKSALVAEGRRVRLERRPRNVKPLLEQLAAAGYTAVATVTPQSTVSTLQFRPLG
ncbi:histidine--tRNA ligase [Marisediminicola senii]|uniref:histidine--tRNA ligase n=1 Tax=Marisediminicola senii TaxID=2711233 RepID=UPI0013EC468F|nr:ATP phosphoribosyltransferase regulatory subunit [Marisediminicola senii]